jgi:hypothetical protein
VGHDAAAERPAVRRQVAPADQLPVLQAESEHGEPDGSPLEMNLSGGGTADCQSFGESNCSSHSTYKNAVLTSKYTAGNSVHGNVTSTTAVASGLNIFGDPNAVYRQFRRLILGVDHTSGGTRTLRNLPTCNLDMAVAKDFKVSEQIGVTFNAQFSNMLNHFQVGVPGLNIDSPTGFGVITTQANTPRQIEFGLRVRF